MTQFHPSNSPDTPLSLHQILNNFFVNRNGLLTAKLARIFDFSFRPFPGLSEILSRRRSFVLGSSLSCCIQIFSHSSAILALSSRPTCLIWRCLLFSCCVSAVGSGLVASTRTVPSSPCKQMMLGVPLSSPHYLSKWFPIWSPGRGKDFSKLPRPALPCIVACSITLFLRRIVTYLLTQSLNCIFVLYGKTKLLN